MKYNFTLTKETYPILIYKLNQMRNRTGRIGIKHYYSGVKKMNSVIKHLRISGKIESSAYSVFDKENITNDWYMRISPAYKKRMHIAIHAGDSGHFINFGTKLYISNNKIVYKKDCISNYATVIIKPF